MTTGDASAAEIQVAALTGAVRGASTLSWRWLVKRSVLWLAVLALGIAAACLLYMAASKAEADSSGRSAASIAITV